jgi:WD40 repeat protein
MYTYINMYVYTYIYIYEYVVAYGRGDITGWCDFPGAVCMWNVFGKNFDPINPDFVLDHNSCIMSVKCHPLLPAVIAGGSFNGEIIVWDLTLSEQVLAVSPILEYGHKEPVLDLEWVYDPGHSEWLLSSIGKIDREVASCVLHFRRVLFTIKLLHKCFELLCSLFTSFGWVYVFYVGHIDKIMKPFSML